MNKEGGKFALELRTDGVQWAGPQATATSLVERSEGLGSLETLTSFQPALRILPPMKNQDYIERDSFANLDFVFCLFVFSLESEDVAVDDFNLSTQGKEST